MVCTCINFEFFPPTFPSPLISHSHCGMCLSVCVAACARPPHMVPFHSCVDCAPPLQISEVSESPHHRCSFTLPGLILSDTQISFLVHAQLSRTCLKINAGVGGAWNHGFFGMAFVALPPGHGFRWECFLQGRGFAFGRVHTAPAGCAGLLLLVG